MGGEFASHAPNSWSINWLSDQILAQRIVNSLSHQLQLRPALPSIEASKEYRELRDQFVRIDEILIKSGLDNEFIELSMKQQGFDPAERSVKKIDRFCKTCVLALRSNIARHLLGMDHRDFCVRIADSQLLQWFMLIGRVDGVKAFAKSSSDRLAHWLDEPNLHAINTRLVALLAGTEMNADIECPVDLGLEEDICFDDIYFDSTCLKAPIHFPVDWVLLRDVVRTLMKATLLIRQAGLRSRMPQEPLSFLSDMNTLCMKMTAKFRTKEGRKHRKAVLREMKRLTKRIGKHAGKHLAIFEKRASETELGEGHVRQIKGRIQEVLDQLPAAIKQAHERIIGGRKLPNKAKILSLYDPDVDVIVRGKSGAEVEFGNKLWLGETREGLIVDYLLEKDQSGDTRHVGPAMKRLVTAQSLPVKSVWGDRGLHSEANEKQLEDLGIRSGLCPRSVGELADRLKNEPGMREGLKRRAGTEARISILVRNFMGKPARAKGFKHREMLTGWAVLSHNLWVVARLKRAESSVEAGTFVPEVEAA
jgi:hypothetical protein